jgi:hypothetical protein
MNMSSLDSTKTPSKKERRIRRLCARLRIAITSLLWHAPDYYTTQFGWMLNGQPIGKSTDEAIEKIKSFKAKADSQAGTEWGLWCKMASAKPSRPSWRHACAVMAQLANAEHVSRKQSGILVPHARKSKWEKACNKMARRACGKFRQGEIADPWEVKVQTWLACIRIRFLFKRRALIEAAVPSRKCKTWDEAAVLLWTDFHAQYRYWLSSPWDKWANTCAKNNNRRSEKWGKEST